jgi:hypothetical protein
MYCVLYARHFLASFSIHTSVANSILVAYVALLTFITAQGAKVSEGNVFYLRFLLSATRVFAAAATAHVNEP